QRQFWRCLPVILNVRRNPSFAEKPSVVKLPNLISREYAHIALQKLQQAVEIIRSGTAETRRVVLVKSLVSNAELQAVRPVRPENIVGDREPVRNHGGRKDAAWTDARKAGDCDRAVVNAQPRIELKWVRSIPRRR